MDKQDKTSRDTRTDKPDRLTESDLANEKMGRNSLQGDDQESVRNQRHSVPDEKVETEGVVESFRKMDPRERTKP